MANKVKRLVSEVEVTDDSRNAKSTGQETKKVFKKAKVNDNCIQTDNKAKELQLTKLSQGNNANAFKKSKQNKASNVKSVFVVSEADSQNLNVKPRKEKVLDEKAIMTKDLKLLKVKQLKREKKKQLRRERGQYNINSIIMSAEAMRHKINEIEGRENITKTAKRKLSLLKKKLKIVEGTAPALPPPPKTKASEEVTSVLSKKQKKKLKKEKLQLENANKKHNDSADASPDQLIIEFENKKIKLELNNKKLNLKKLKTEKKLQKPGQNTKVSVKSRKEHESESIEDESEDESLEESLTPISVIKKKGISIETEADDISEEGDENEEENEAENDEENEDLEKQDDEGNEESDDDEEEDNIIQNALPKKLTDIKKQKEAKNKNAPTKIQNQQIGDKKKRYVLFVGNIPFKATVEDIKQHFLQKVSEVVSVRIPTAKGSKKPRGFAYVEVSNNVDYEKGLSLHQTSLQGFKINVEYTQTGSKNIKNKQELVAKNKKLHAVRKAGKLAGSKKENHKRSFRRKFKKSQQAHKN